MRRVLTVLALGAALYVSYQWWDARQTDPAPLPVSAPAVPTKPATSPFSQQMPAPPTAQPPPRISAPVQMVTPGVLMEGTPHASLLNDLWRTLERGNVVEAEARLAVVPRAAMDDPVSRKFIADLWNNLGVTYAVTRGMADGVQAFKTAVSLAPDGARAHVNLVHALWELREPGLNRDLIEKTIALAPEEPLPHLLLADIFQAQGDLKKVVEQLDLAAQYAGQSPKLQAFVQSESAKVKQGLTAAERAKAKTPQGARAPATPLAP